MAQPTCDGEIARLLHALRSPVSTVLIWESVIRRSTDDKLRARGLDAIRACALAQSSLLDELAAAIRAGQRG